MTLPSRRAHGDDNVRNGEQRGKGVSDGRELPILGQDAPKAERADAARNRRRILDAARQLLRQRPLQDICMDDVARAARVGKGTLYRRFADRSALCHALLDDSERALQARVARRFQLPKSASAEAHLHALLDALLAFSFDHLPILVAAEESHRPHQRFTSEVYRWRSHVLANAIAAAWRESGRPPSMSSLLAADLSLATMSPILLQQHLADGIALDEVRRSRLAFLLHGLLGVVATP